MNSSGDGPNYNLGSMASLSTARSRSRTHAHDEFPDGARDLPEWARLPPQFILSARRRHDGCAGFGELEQHPLERGQQGRVEVVSAIERRREDKTHMEICEELNRLGFRTRMGQPWRHSAQIIKLLRSFSGEG
jgi:hypothetical protein